MLLARAGHRVALVDRARFPSDTLSTHFMQPRGASYLARWGLLEPVLRRDALVDALLADAGRNHGARYDLVCAVAELEPPRPEDVRLHAGLARDPDALATSLGVFQDVLRPEAGLSEERRRELQETEVTYDDSIARENPFA